MCAKINIFPVDNDMEQMKATVELIRLIGSSYQLSSTVHKCDRVTKILERVEYPASPELLSSELKELLERLEDDLRSEVFLHVPKNQADLYNDPLQGWDRVIERFPRIRYNIEESGKCFALERYGAAVFHIMQVAEYGVIAVAKTMGYPGDKPGWGSLKWLSGLIKEPYPKRTPDAQKNSEMLEHVIPLTIAMKDAWRHKLDHVDNQIVWVDTDFSPAVAEEIISATRAFMRKLSFELPRGDE